MTKLLRALESYEKALTKHEQQVKSQFSQVERRYSRLASVYEGAGAKDFSAHWSRSTRSMQEYVNGTEQIRRVLKDRIEKLRQADRAGSL